MKKMKLLSFTLFIITTIVGSAQTKLPSILSDNMCLQQSADVEIWGWDTPGQKVIVNPSWGKLSKIITDEEGNWLIRIKTPKAGMSDPHMLVVDNVCYVFTGHDVGFGIADWVMPDWRIYRSIDMLTWEHVGTIKPEDNYMGKGNTSCWAGDIVERNGKYYWYFSNRKESTGVMVASKPEGPYADALGKPLVDIDKYSSC
jgi:hypothetical protein